MSGCYMAPKKKKKKSFNNKHFVAGPQHPRVWVVNKKRWAKTAVAVKQMKENALTNPSKGGRGFSPHKKKGSVRGGKCWGPTNIWFQHEVRVIFVGCSEKPNGKKTRKRKKCRV